MTGSGSAIEERLDEARMRQMLEHLPYFAVIIDRERRYVWVNRLDQTLDVSQVLGRKVDEFLHESALPTVLGTIDRAFQTGEVSHYEARAYGEGGMETWYATTVVPLPADEWGAARALLLSVDVTERRTAEDALRKSERRFRMLTESSPDLILIVDHALCVRYVNRDPQPGMGITRERVVGKPIRSFMFEEDSRGAIETMKRSLASGEPGTYEVRSAATKRWFEARVLRLSGDDPEPQLLITATDVTEQRLAAEERAALEAQLQQAHKLETIGQLAGGVAHDFNNLLTVIKSRLAFARRALAERRDPEDDLEAIESAVDRASGMTRRLLTLGRRQTREPTRFDLAELAQETMRLLDRMMPESIEMRLRAEAGDCIVFADRAELQQVLINLCLNARDAIETVGAIDVRVARAEGEGEATCLLAVSDTGRGMDRAVAQRAFEPFFTTKPVGQGTGLGLSMVHAIVTANAGRVSLDSEPGRGTTVTIRLSSAGARAEAPRSDPAPPREASRPGGTILLAEDDSGVREALVRILELEGYDVIQARNGQEAVETFRTRHQDIDLVMLDAVMPVLGGKDAYERMVGIRPDVRILFSSGYSPERLPSPSPDGVQRVRVLAKPYSPDELLDAVRTLLAVP